LARRYQISGSVPMEPIFLYQLYGEGRVSVIYGIIGTIGTRHD